MYDLCCDASFNFIILMNIDLYGVLLNYYCLYYDFFSYGEGSVMYVCMYCMYYYVVLCNHVCIAHVHKIKKVSLCLATL